jgi:protein TonB
MLAATPREVTISLIGGPTSLESIPPRPASLVAPTLLDLPPPVLEVNDSILIADAIAPSGSPNVTTPATAIAEQHTFPRMPLLSKEKTATVRLLLSIATDGTVVDASVAESSRNAALDSLAIAWVKAHWRYRPALQNGEPIAVVTTAIMTFVRGG